mgnify:CR=1 FL=1
MLIDLRKLLSGAKDDMPVELVLTRTGKDKLHISGNGIVALKIPCDR